MSGLYWLLILSLWGKIGSHFVRFGVTGSGSLRLVVCRSGTKWPRILSPWDKLGGIVRDWRRSGVTGSGSLRLVVCRSGTKRLLMLSPWGKMASHFVLLGQTGWDCSGLEAVRRHRIRLLEVRSLSLWDKIGLLFCRLGTKWPLILSSWDKLGGIVRDWRRFGVTGSGSWRLVVCRSGTKLGSHFVALGQNGLVYLLEPPCVFLLQFT